MFSPLLRLCPPPRCGFGLVCGDFHNSARTAIRSRLCGPNILRLSQFCTFFAKIVFFDCARALFLTAQAWRLRISLKTRSAHACAVQTRFRPFIFEECFKYCSLKCTGLLHFCPALLRLSHAWPFSARNEIRSRLCSPNTHSPRPFFHSFAEMCFFTAPEPLF